MKEYKLVLAIFVAGIVLRVSFLGLQMPYLFRDEAALGYNAYSIWLTGRDEFGEFLPIVFRSFEVFFLPLYVYLSAPIVGILGLSIFSTRLLSAISGIFALIFVYKIAEELWNKKVAIFSLTTLSFAPWHIFYSRGTFEGNLALTLLFTGVYFWILFVKNKLFKYFCISTFFLTLSMYSYQSARVIVPLFAIFAIFTSFKQIWKLKQKIFIWGILLLILLSPLISLSFRAGGLHRVAGVSIFTQENPPGWITLEKPGLLTNNKFYLRSKQISSLYSSYFSPKNLFWVPDANQQRGLDHISVFYFWGLPFLFAGLYKLFKRNNYFDKLILFLMLVAPLPAALTADPFHTYRSLNLYFMLSLIIGLGACELVKNKYFFIILNLISLPFFIYNYYVLAPITRAKDWDFGYEELISEITRLPEDSPVVIYNDNTESYIHYLFFNKIDPGEYQLAISDLNLQDSYYYDDPIEIRADKFRNIEFRSIDWPSERGDKGSYFVFRSDLLPDSEFKTDPNIELISELFFPDHSSAYKIVHVKDE